MRRLFYILFHCGAAISLLLCVAAALLWVRSEWVGDGFTWVGAEPPYPLYSYSNCLGILSVSCLDLNSPRERGGPFQHMTLELDAELVASYRDSFARNTWHGFGYRQFDISAPRDTPFTPRYYCAVPHWFIVILTAALPAAAFYRGLRRRRWRSRRGSGRCAACGYDLRATPERCPECGAVPDVVRPSGVQ